MKKLKILAYAHPYLPYHNAGGETTSQDMLAYLVSQGWEANVCTSGPTPATEPYSLDGVNVMPFTNRRQVLFEVPKHDLVVAHLGTVPRAAILGRKFRIPVLQILHNDFHWSRTGLGMQCDLAVFNTDWLSAVYPDFPGERVVLHPPVDRVAYDVSKSNTKEHITLVNLWPDKGSHVFWHLAEKFPDQKFLGVKGGYGEQDIRDLSQYPNVTIIPNISYKKMADEVYASTKIVLMPSAYESYGRVAVEAGMSGIPTIAHPTVGLQEALGPAGTFVDRADLEGWEAALKKMLHPRAYSAAVKRTLARADGLTAQRKTELEEFALKAREIALLGRSRRGEV